MSAVGAAMDPALSSRLGPAPGEAGHRLHLPERGADPKPDPGPHQSPAPLPEPAAPAPAPLPEPEPEPLGESNLPGVCTERPATPRCTPRGLDTEALADALAADSLSPSPAPLSPSTASGGSSLGFCLLSDEIPPRVLAERRRARQAVEGLAHGAHLDEHGELCALPRPRALLSKLGLLDHAASTHDGSLLLQAVLFFKETVREATFVEHLRTRPACIRRYAAHLCDCRRWDELRDLLVACGQEERALLVQYARSCRLSSSRGDRRDIIQACADAAFEVESGCDVAAGLMQEHSALLFWAHDIAAGAPDDALFVHISECLTELDPIDGTHAIPVSNSNLMSTYITHIRRTDELDAGHQPEVFASRFGLTPGQRAWATVRAHIEALDWDRLLAALTRREGLIFEGPLVLAPLAAHVRVEQVVVMAHDAAVESGCSLELDSKPMRTLHTLLRLCPNVVERFELAALLAFEDIVAAAVEWMCAELDEFGLLSCLRKIECWQAVSHADRYPGYREAAQHGSALQDSLAQVADAPTANRLVQMANEGARFAYQGGAVWGQSAAQQVARAATDLAAGVGSAGVLVGDNVRPVLGQASVQVGRGVGEALLALGTSLKQLGTT